MLDLRMYHPFPRSDLPLVLESAWPARGGAARQIKGSPGARRDSRAGSFRDRSESVGVHSILWILVAESVVVHSIWWMVDQASVVVYSILWIPSFEFAVVHSSWYTLGLRPFTKCRCAQHSLDPVFRICRCAQYLVHTRS